MRGKWINFFLGLAVMLISYISMSISFKNGDNSIIYGFSLVIGLLFMIFLQMKGE
jgi:hypothetical protein